MDGAKTGLTISSCKPACLPVVAARAPAPARPHRPSLPRRSSTQPARTCELHTCNDQHHVAERTGQHLHL
eukprot:4667652-Alexandrium_andersonii.AAC.1